MKSKFKLTDEYLSHFDSSVRDLVLRAVDDVEDPVVKRVANVDGYKLCDEEGKDALVQMTLSTRDLDRDDEIILPTGMDITAFRKNPVWLLNHDWSSLPIGSVRNVQADEYSIFGLGMFGDTAIARDAKSLVTGGHMRANSIGFIPTRVAVRGSEEYDQAVKAMVDTWPEFGVDKVARLRAVILSGVLLENSLVTVPANPQALIQAMADKPLESEKMYELVTKSLPQPPAEPELCNAEESPAESTEPFQPRLLNFKPRLVKKAKKLTAKDIGSTVSEALLIHRGRV
jgi:phage head maturation protease